jgi:hypothetical protein
MNCSAVKSINCWAANNFENFVSAGILAAGKVDLWELSQLRERLSHFHCLFYKLEIEIVKSV